MTHSPGSHSNVSIIIGNTIEAHTVCHILDFVPEVSESDISITLICQQLSNIKSLFSSVQQSLLTKDSGARD